MKKVVEQVLVSLEKAIAKAASPEVVDKIVADIEAAAKAYSAAVKSGDEGAQKSSLESLAKLVIELGDGAAQAPAAGAESAVPPQMAAKALVEHATGEVEKAFREDPRSGLARLKHLKAVLKAVVLGGTIEDAATVPVPEFADPSQLKPETLATLDPTKVTQPDGAAHAQNPDQVQKGLSDLEKAAGAGRAFEGWPMSMTAERRAAARR